MKTKKQRLNFEKILSLGLIAGLVLAIVALIISYEWAKGDTWTALVVTFATGITFIVGTLVAMVILIVSNKSKRVAVGLSGGVVILVGAGIIIGR